MIIERKITGHLRKMLEKFPILTVTGPRQSGKTTLLTENFKDYRYYNMERIDFRRMFLSDPAGFLESAGDKVIFDEAQHLRELFSYIQIASDASGKTGQYILSGSQRFLLNESIAQSLAGRVNINLLLPFDMTELGDDYKRELSEMLFAGFYPRLIQREIDPNDFYPSYIQTYIERDIRTLRAIDNLDAFVRFIGLCAGRTGQMLNLSSLANDCGVSVNTAKSWISVLEASYVLFTLKPYYNNLNKRLIKAPKLYFYDTGVVSSLLRITDSGMIRNHYLYGALFESMVISEIAKLCYHTGKRPNIYYWRESNGMEIDCIVEVNSEKILAIEIKGGATFHSEFLKNLKPFPDMIQNAKVKKYLIYGGDINQSQGNIQIAGWRDFSGMMAEEIG